MIMSNELAGINRIDILEKCIKKLSFSPTELTKEEKDYILTTAALLIKKFSLDKRHVSYVELAYFIILNYSLAFQDYAPLYDFSIAFGLYPISYAITKNGWLSFGSIADCLIETKIEKKFRNQNIIETYEQQKIGENILTTDYPEKCIIAPTSFGKSHLILSHITHFFERNKRYAIIIPSKALLSQTYRNVKSLNLGIRIITHDEMYQEQDIGFIGVLTQERAFRLMNKHDVSFDYMYIDEAHQLLENDSRSILLSRLIKLNKKRNRDCNFFYFSPLVSDSSNLALKDSNAIIEKRIRFNMKEPKIFEYQNDGSKRIYNRFVNDFYKIDKTYVDLFNYLSKNEGQKNFIYLYTPKKIQIFSSKLLEKRTEISNSKAINEIVDNLNRYVHVNFYLTDCIKKGFIYIHGKLPDIVRDYLLAKFSKIPELSMVIANTVILEGVNLPIDTLFILTSNGLNKTGLINLIGRVNRLNEIFEKHTHLEKLQPAIHFVNSDEFNRRNGNLANKIRELKKTEFVDEINNPLLHNFKMPKEQKKRDKAINIQRDDEIFFSSCSNKVDQLKRKMIELGINNFYKNIDLVAQKLYDNFNNHDQNIFLTTAESKASLPIMDRLCILFIDNLKDYIIDDEVKRLENPQAISYYKIFLNNRKLSLKEKISREVAYFKKLLHEKNSIIYIGKSFGEMPNPWKSESGPDTYVDLSKKNDKELVNLAIIRQKQEEDFVSYKLLMFFQLMFDYNQITKDEYEQIIYGSNDPMEIHLIRQGLPINVVKKLREDNQLDNIYVDEYGNIQCNDAFNKYKDTLDDLLKFEIDRVI